MPWRFLLLSHSTAAGWEEHPLSPRLQEYLACVKQAMAAGDELELIAALTTVAGYLERPSSSNGSSTSSSSEVLAVESALFPLLSDSTTPRVLLATTRTLLAQDRSCSPTSATLSLMRMVFKASKDANNDHLFGTHGLIGPLAKLMASKNADLAVYACGTLRNITTSATSTVHLSTLLASHPHPIPTLTKMLTEALTGSQQSSLSASTAAVQVTGLLRNLSTVPDGRIHFTAPPLFNAMTKALAVSASHPPLTFNIVRTWAKLSLFSDFASLLASSGEALDALVRTLVAAGPPPGSGSSGAIRTPQVLLRSAFILANLTSEGTYAPSVRTEIATTRLPDGRGALEALGDAAAAATRAPNGMDLVAKTLRLLANIAMDPSLGVPLSVGAAPDAALALAQTPEFSTALDKVSAGEDLEAAREEAWVATVCFAANISCCGGSRNGVVEQKMAWARVLIPVLTSPVAEATAAAARALANFTQDPMSPVTPLAAQLHADKALWMLTDSQDESILYDVLGVLVNTAAHPTWAAGWTEANGPNRLLSLITSTEDPGVAEVTCKALSNWMSTSGATLADALIDSAIASGAMAALEDWVAAGEAKIRENDYSSYPEDVAALEWTLDVGQALHSELRALIARQE